MPAPDIHDQSRTSIGDNKDYRKLLKLYELIKISRINSMQALGTLYFI